MYAGDRPAWYQGRTPCSTSLWSGCAASPRYPDLFAEKARPPADTRGLFLDQRVSRFERTSDGQMGLGFFVFFSSRKFYMLGYIVFRYDGRWIANRANGILGA